MSPAEPLRRRCQRILHARHLGDSTVRKGRVSSRKTGGVSEKAPPSSARAEGELKKQNLARSQRQADQAIRGRKRTAPLLPGCGRVEGGGKGEKENLRGVSC